MVWMGGEGVGIKKRHCCVEYRGDFVLGVGYEMWDIVFGIGRIWKDRDIVTIGGRDSGKF
jgi:hypothetical protein